ncbi:sugar phosphate isomerase/epimerase [Pseudomonas sp. 2FE]|uniref:sugar phosphate isomerase/epimerase family protein n=1 Tax=Pseudomonas sp. 2FE TaxID=2502190 RepID=UPI0010F8DC45|nr:sugar phosphate isomerase/epimerase family protein [Pseudomonas sp. 2FE]
MTATAAQLNELASRIGISTNLFLEEENVEELVCHLANHFPVVEVEIEGTVRQVSDEAKNLELARTLRKISEETGSIINIHAPYIRVDYILGSEEERAKARETIIHAAEFAIAAGSKIMTFHPGFRFPKNGGAEMRAGALALIQELTYDLFHVNKHKGADLTYSLENSGNERPFLTLTHEENEELFSTSPLSLTLDMAHAASYCSNVAQAQEEMKRFAKYAANVHLADIKFPKHLHLPLGQGDFDFHDMILAIEETGYTGPYIVEEIGAGYKGQDYFDAALHYRDQLRSRSAA